MGWTRGINGLPDDGRERRVVDARDVTLLVCVGIYSPVCDGGINPCAGMDVNVCCVIATTGSI
jgi:hypothetical protein